MESAAATFDSLLSGRVRRAVRHPSGHAAIAPPKPPSTARTPGPVCPQGLESARVRLKDVFDVFADLSAGLVGELATAYRDQPDINGFVLSECFVDVRSIQPEVKVAVASRLTLNDKASIRYEAVRALDAINDAAASTALRQLQTSETNRDVKNLIEASLGSPSRP